MRTRTSSAILGAPLVAAIEHRQRLVEVERDPQRVEVQPELHHRDRDLRRNADDDRLGAAQSRREDDRAQRSRDEGVDDVESTDVDLGMMKTVGDLQGGLEEAERLAGYRAADPSDIET